jgi:shikimate kinase
MAVMNRGAYIGRIMGVVLIGYRGSGKTTVGRLLAERLGKSFLDCDVLIVKKARRSIREIFLAEGEEGFRKLESAVISEHAANDCVIAVGGGAVIREENQRSLKGAGHQLVYLRCDARELLRRIRSDPGTSDNRPNLTSLGGGIEEIQAVLEEREPIYRALMSAEIDVTTLSPLQTVDRLAKLIGND